MKKADGNVAMQNKGSPSLAGQFLKTYREKKHLTQEQLAEDLRVEPRTLRAWENGERQLTNINELSRIADTLQQIRYPVQYRRRNSRIHQPLRTCQAGA